VDSQEYLRRHWYNHEKGFENTNPGWYTVEVQTSTEKQHKDIVQWLYDKLDNPERHCVWVAYNDYSCFRFRHEKDYLWFRLAW
jgi:hypothetical protein